MIENDIYKSRNVRQPFTKGFFVGRRAWRRR